MPLQSYWVNDRELPDGSHEVHKEACERMPDLENREPLGLHEDSASALAYAKLLHLHFESVKMCASCFSDQQPYLDPKL